MLDGFPLTLAQAESLNQLLNTEGIWLSAVLCYELWASEIVARLGGPRTCEKWKAAYHVTEWPPKLEGRCDRCDGKLFQRADDRQESIKVRLETDEQSTAPLIEFYNKLGPLVQVAATGSPDEISTGRLARWSHDALESLPTSSGTPGRIAARVVSQFSNRDTAAPMFPRF